MRRAIRVLLVEDSSDDAELVVRELSRGGYDAQLKRVETASDMAAALREEPWDLIISDYALPRFSAPEAYAVLQASGLDIPFIIVSGTVGEETAVQAMKLGVQDYLLKGNLQRLSPAIERELREREGRQARREAEQQLQRFERRYRELFECTPVPMWVVDIETLKFLAVNEAAVRQYGYDREEFSRLTLSALSAPEGAAPAQDAAIRVSASGEGVMWHVRKDGSFIAVEMKSRDLEFQDRRARLMAVNDVTERLRAEQALRRTEEQLRQAQKMEAIGSLAGGVAHDFNNMLTIILSYAELAMAALNPGHEMRDDLNEILKAADRASNLTRQLLAFSRQQVLEPRVLDLNQVVRGIEKMLRRLLREDIEVFLVLPPNLDRIHADPGQLEQILMNLVVNARDAMPRGGSLTIETCNVELNSEAAARLIDVTPGRYVMLSVKDTGTGMDQETQARIFEPFFTTKQLGEGTGLGLSTVYGIVKQSGGHIWVDSELHKGTTFRIYFPRTEQRESDSLMPVSSSAKSLQGSETILLVEDEAQVRTIMRTILRRYGYNVLEAPSGLDALAISEQYEAEIDLLITDVVMPRLGGREVAERIAVTRPAIKVLYVSGYAEDPRLRHGALGPGTAYYQKPITPETFAQKVRELLDIAHSG